MEAGTTPRSGRVRGARMTAVRNLARAWRLLRAQGGVPLARMALHQARRGMARRRSGHEFLRSRPALGDLLGMTTPEEQAWLYWYAAREHQGRGAIVDLGCWLGASTVPLLAGLDANPAAAARASTVHAYDLFVWEEWMEDSVAGTRLAGRHRPGESFLPAFAERTAHWKDRLKVHAGDLCRESWPSGEPIEILFNDAAKSWELANTVRREFLPGLVPGVSRLVEQDFAHYFTPWVHVLRHRLRDHLEPLLAIPYSGSMVFRVTREIPRELVQQPLHFADFDAEEVERAFAESLAMVDRPMRPNVWAARVMWEVHQGKLERARALYAEAPKRGYRGLDLAKLPNWLARGRS